MNNRYKTYLADAYVIGITVTTIVLAAKMLMN